MKMEHYLAHTDYPIWEVIQNGNGPVSITTDTSGQIKVLPPRTAEEIVARERERKARTTLLMALPEDHLAKFHKMTDAKEMWDAIKSRFGGNDESREEANQLEIHGAGVSTEDANKKFLRSLPSAWSQVSLIMRTKPGVDTLSFDDLYNNLRVFESDIKGSTASSSLAQKYKSVESREIKITGGMHGILETRMGAETGQRRDSKAICSDSDTEREQLSDASIEIKAYSQGLKKVEASSLLITRNNFVSTVGEKGKCVKPKAGCNWSSKMHGGSKYNGGSSLDIFKGYITGKGKIKTGKLDFEDVCFVKELQHFNLFSMSQMCDKKNKVLFTDSECLVLSPEFKLPDENQVYLKSPDKTICTASIREQCSLSQQETNQNVGTEEIIDAGDSDKEDESAQDCFVLPIWPSYSSTITPALTTDDKREGGKEDVEALRKKFEHLVIKEEAARPSSTNIFSTVSTPAKASGTNLVNTVSIPVSTASPHEGISLAEPINPKEDDSEIPPLEDIYQNSTDGIFTTSSYDDEGAVADFTNLETVVNVSPIPTSRIHSIHPKALILGDPTSTVQTRSKVNTSSGAHAFVSYVQKQKRTNHKDFHHCLFACFLSQHEPKKISEALEDESWVDAMQEELLQFEIQKVWVLVDLPYGKKAIGTKWVYRNKKDERGVVVRNKARLVAQGHRQEEGIDYDEVFAPVARLEAIRIFLAFASYMGFIVYQMDVKSVFLYGKIDEKLIEATLLTRKSFPKKQRVHKESVSKQGRKFAKGESSVQRDPLFDEIPEDTVDHMETENAQNEGRTREMVDEDKEIDENILSTEDVLSTDKDGVSTDMEKVSTDRPIVSTDGSKVSTDKQNEGTEENFEGTEEHIEGTEEQVESTDGHKKGTEEEIATQATQTSTQTPTSTIFGDDETIAKVLLNMSQAKAVSREKEKGVELKDVEETDRPRPTSTRSLLTLKPLPKIDPKDKGKKKIEEEDESKSEDDAEEERNIIAEEKAVNEALIRNFDDIKARIEADRLLAEKLQEQEREQFTIEERAKFLHDTIAAQRRFLAQQRSEAIRNRPPTKNQLRNQMMTYLKHVGNFKHAELKIKKFKEVQALYEKIKRSDEDFISIGSAEDERLIKRMNEKGVDFSKSKVLKEESKEEVQKESKEEESTRKRKLGTRKKMKSRKRRYIQNTSEDDSDKENDELRLHLTIAPDEEKEVDYEILDRKYPIKEWKTECLGTKPQTDQAEHFEEINQNVVIRSNGQKRYFSTLMRVLSIFDREDLNAVYQLVMDRFQDEIPEGFDRVLWGDLMVMFNPDDENEFWNAQQDWNIVSWKLHSSSGVHTLVTETGLVIHMLVEKKYPLRKEVLMQMLKLKLESEEDSTMALELIRFIKKLLAELEPEEKG
ncbi:putative ribonuclease H-like domain-containing protein [Tanacetum coccineum]|uniref:Ribonuclease H-like domain-containing protein n=1 Tax=Tanacetum coccineum TaxID=301880 RepID=A0ABQ4XLB7_9ASTR